MPMTDREAMDAARPDRRRFLNLTWKVLGVALVAEAGWTSYDLLVPRPSGGFGGLVEAGPVEAFPEGTVQYFLQGRFYVSSVEGKLLALYQKCPHLGCRVPFCDRSMQFECPCHGSIYTMKGEYVAGPAPRGLDRFPIAIREGKVVVDTGTIIEGPARGVLTMSPEPQGSRCLAGEGSPDTGDTAAPAEGAEGP